jgi:hypothetical protein
MGKKLIDEVKTQMEKKNTDELLEIWTKNDREQWSDDAFEAVRQVLVNRGLAVPPQSPSPVPSKDAVMRPTPSLRRKLARLVIGIVACLLALSISTNVATQVQRKGLNSLSDRPGFWLLAGACIMLVACCYWWSQLGRRELHGPVRVAAGTFFSVLFAGGLGMVAVNLSDVGIDAYSLGGIFGTLAFGWLAWRLTFKK